MVRCCCWCRWWWSRVGQRGFKRAGALVVMVWQKNAAAVILGSRIFNCIHWKLLNSLPGALHPSSKARTSLSIYPWLNTLVGCELCWLFTQVWWMWWLLSCVSCLRLIHSSRPSSSSSASSTRILLWIYERVQIYGHAKIIIQFKCTKWEYAEQVHTLLPGLSSCICGCGYVSGLPKCRAIGHDELRGNWTRPSRDQIDHHHGRRRWTSSE